MKPLLRLVFESEWKKRKQRKKPRKVNTYTSSGEKAVRIFVQ